MAENAVEIDWSKVPQSTFLHAEPGNYVVQIVKTELTESQAGNQMINATLEVLEGQYKGRRLMDRFVMTPKALWRLRNALEAMGYKLPNSVQKLKLEAMLNKPFGVTLADGEPYNGRVKSEVQAFLTADVARDSQDEEQVSAETQDEEDDTDELDIDSV